MVSEETLQYNALTFPLRAYEVRQLAEDDDKVLPLNWSAEMKRTT